MTFIRKWWVCSNYIISKPEKSSSLETVPLLLPEHVTCRHISLKAGLPRLQSSQSLYVGGALTQGRAEVSSSPFHPRPLSWTKLSKRRGKRTMKGGTHHSSNHISQTSLMLYITPCSLWKIIYWGLGRRYLNFCINCFCPIYFQFTFFVCSIPYTVC